MANESMKRVSINRLSMEPSRIIKAILEPDYPHAHLEWNVTGEGIEITPMDRQCVVEPIDFDGDSAKATVTATIPDSPSFVGTSASCDVIVVKQPTAIQLSAVGAPGGYMVTVVQSAESYSRLWKLDAGDVYQGDVCDESGGWQPLPEDGIIDALSGVLTVVDVDSSHGARRAGSVMLQPSANLACYGPVDGCAVVGADGALRLSGLSPGQLVEWPLPVEEYRGRTLLLSLKDDDARIRFGLVVDGSVGSNYVDGQTRSRQVSVPDEAVSVSIRVQDVNLDHEGVLHPGAWSDASERPAWTPGIIVGGGVSGPEPVNIYPEPVFDEPNVNDVVWRDNGDGSWHASGTASSWSTIQSKIVLKPGEYLLTADVNGTDANNLYAEVRNPVYKNTCKGAVTFVVDSEQTLTFAIAAREHVLVDATIRPGLYSLTSGGGVSDKRPNLLTYVDSTVEGGVLTVNGDGSFDLTVTDWPQWRNMVFYLPEGTFVAGRTYTLSIQEPYESPTVSMHVRSLDDNGFGPLRLVSGKSSVTATLDAISTKPNLTIINEQPASTSGSLRNVRLKLEEGDSPTGWVPPVVSSGGGIAISSPR